MEASTVGQPVLTAFAAVPDPRSRHGRRHSLPAILALATAAMLSGARSRSAIAQWGRLQPPEVGAALGFRRPRTPAVATLPAVFRDLDAAAFEATVGAWAQACLGERADAIAIDGNG